MDVATVRAWWWHRQGLDGSLAGASPAEVLARSGWARSVGGVGPYLTLFARAGTSRAEVDKAVEKLEIHELPSARACTYVLPAQDFALGLTLAADAGGSDMKQAIKLGVTEDEISALCDAVRKALAGRTLSPDEIREATGTASRSLGEAGKVKGISTTLPLALGRLQEDGHIRRVPLNGRLDQQRYAYTLWKPNPRAKGPRSAAEAYVELARRFFTWVGPATLGEWQSFSGLGVKASRDVTASLGLEPAAPGSDRLLLPDDVAAFRTFKAPSAPQYALVSSLDAIAATRREMRTLIDDVDLTREVVSDKTPVAMSALSDLPSHAILDRGRLIGLWEYDPDAGEIVWGTFGVAADDALRAAIARTEAYVRDELGDARSFSLDSPKTRAPRLAAIRGMN